MNNPKRHHYVPEMLSQRFLNPDGKVWYFDKRRPALGIRDSLPANLMLEGYLYSEKLDDGTKDHSLEFQFSVLESEASPVLDKIEEYVLRNLIPVLTSSERETLIEFVCAQWRRVPDFNNQVFESDRYKRIVDDAVKKYEQQMQRALSEAERQTIDNMRKDKNVKDRSRVRALRRVATQVISALSPKTLQFVVTCADSPFVLGSSPVLKTSPSEESANLHHPLAEVQLAFHPRIALRFTNPNGATSLVRAPATDVAFYNEHVARKSSVLASHSKQKLADLLSVASLSTRQGTNASQAP